MSEFTFVCIFNQLIICMCPEEAGLEVHMKRKAECRVLPGYDESLLPIVEVVTRGIAAKQLPVAQKAFPWN